MKVTNTMKVTDTSRWKVLYRIAAPRNSAKFFEKKQPPMENFSIGLCNFTILDSHSRRPTPGLHCRGFLMNFEEILRAFSQNTPRRLLLI